MLSAILVQFRSSVATFAKTARTGGRIAPWLLPVFVAALGTSCASMAKRGDLVIETAAPASGDAAFARHMALRRSEARVRKVPQGETRHATSDDAPDRQRAMKDSAGLPLAVLFSDEPLTCMRTLETAR